MMILLGCLITSLGPIIIEQELRVINQDQKPANTTESQESNMTEIVQDQDNQISLIEDSHQETEIIHLARIDKAQETRL